MRTSAAAHRGSGVVEKKKTLTLAGGESQPRGGKHPPPETARTITVGGVAVDMSLAREEWHWTSPCVTRSGRAAGLGGGAGAGFGAGGRVGAGFGAAASAIYNSYRAGHPGGILQPY